MFLAAARALADCVEEDDLECGRTFPRMHRIRDVSARIAATVFEVAHAQGVARVPTMDDPEGEIRRGMFEPTYRPLSSDPAVLSATP